MSAATYRILDEPQGRGTKLPIFSPFWPFLAMMFGGAWLGASLFAFNAFALRGATFVREVVLSIAILLGSALITLFVAIAVNVQWLPQEGVKYALILVVAWKLGLAYWLFFLQQPSHQLYEYFHPWQNPRTAQAGIAIVIAGSFLRSNVVSAFDSPFWSLAVS